MKLNPYVTLLYKAFSSLLNGFQAKYSCCATKIWISYFLYYCVALLVKANKSEYM